MPETSVKDKLSLHRVPAVYMSFGIAVLSILCAVQPGLAKEANKPVARVNGVTIYQSDLSFAVEASLARKLSSPSKSSIGSGSRRGTADLSKTIRQLIGIELLYQESRKKEIRIESQAIDIQMNDIKKRFPNDAEFQKAIAQMNLSEAIIKEQIESLQKFVESPPL